MLSGRMEEAGEAQPAWHGQRKNRKVQGNMNRTAQPRSGTRAVGAILFAICIIACTVLFVLPQSAQAATKTKVTGVAKKFDAHYSKSKLKDKITVSPAYGRKVKLYRYDTAKKKYVLEKTFKTKNKKKATLTITYPKSWKTYARSTWRVVVPYVKKTVKTVKKKVTVQVKEKVEVPVESDTADSGNDKAAKTVTKTVTKNVTKTVKKKVTVRGALKKKSIKVKVTCDFLTCDTGIVMDADTGKVVYSYNPFLKHRIASLTKMMTATLLAERADTTPYVKFTSAAVNTPYAYGFAYGETLSAKNAIYAMMLPSSNDAATATGIAISGSTSKFCKLMNKRAKQLGCRSTVYKNAHGLDRYGAHSTVYDQALIACNILNSPKLKTVRKAARTQAKTIYTTDGARYRLHNKNQLLGTSWKAIGMKTGTEDDAGYCLACATEVKGKNYVTIVLGAYSDYGRYKNTKRLIKFARYAAKHKLPEYEL